MSKRGADGVYQRHKSSVFRAPARRLFCYLPIRDTKARGMVRKKRDIFSSLLGKLSPNHNDTSVTSQASYQRFLRHSARVLSVYTNCLSHHSACTVAGSRLSTFEQFMHIYDSWGTRGTCVLQYARRIEVTSHML